jgi:hypothetical protein
MDEDSLEEEILKILNKDKLKKWPRVELRQAHFPQVEETAFGKILEKMHDCSEPKIYFPSIGLVAAMR